MDLYCKGWGSGLDFFKPAFQLVSYFKHISVPYICLIIVNNQSLHHFTYDETALNYKALDKQVIKMFIILYFDHKKYKYISNVYSLKQHHRSVSNEYLQHVCGQIRKNKYQNCWLKIALSTYSYA